MNENNKKELLIRIKVNKKYINKKKENNQKGINNRTNISNKTQGTIGIIKRNSFSNRFSDLFKNDLEPNSIYRNYSQRTYNYQNLNKKNINEKGNIIYEMQKNKYLKPLLHSKDIYEKILKCKIADSSFYLFHLNDSSPKLKEESLFKNKEKNTIKKNNLFLLNNLKEFNSNYPIKFTNNYLNDNIKFRNKTNELINSNISFNKIKSYDKIYQTCKNFYYQNISYEPSNNSFKFYSNKNKFSCFSLKSDKKMNNERIGLFCHILELFFLNIIKKNFRKLLNNLKYMSNMNTDRSYYKSNGTYTSGKTFYNTDSAKNYKNNIFTNSINRTSTFSNYFNVFDNNKKYNNYTFFDKGNNSKDMDNFQKRINRIKINKVNKSNSFNNKYKCDSIDNYKTFNKKKISILKKINFEKNLPYYNNLLVYKKKNSFSKKKEIKKINQNNINLPIEIKKSNNFNINLKNTIESELDSDGNINKQNLFIFIKCYMIKDINYRIKYLYKYKNKKKIYYDIPLFYDKSINFSIIKKNKIYKKIKIYKSNKNRNNENKRKYYININSYNKTEDGQLCKNSIKINSHKKKTIIKKENKRNNDNINKILINCVKLLTKIITKLYLKRKFNLFKNNLKNI